jgi:hypothetical protein
MPCLAALMEVVKIVPAWPQTQSCVENAAFRPLGRHGDAT